MPYSSTLSPLLRKLETRAALSDREREAVVTLPYRLRTIDRGAHFVREGERPQRSSLILNGFAFRQKVTPRGTRQILSVHMPGDFVDLEGSLLNVTDHNVEGLTRCELATIERADLRTVATNHPAVAIALWIDTLIDGAMFREWIVNVGRRDAQTRIAHLLCEFGIRLQCAGLGSVDSYEMPMNQDQLADAASLTAVHVNRTLRDMDRSGLIVRKKRKITINDWERLCEIGDFNPNYLHLDQTGLEAERLGTRLPAEN